MQLFNIIKPDMVNDKEALKYYFNIIKNDFKLEIKDIYSVSDWPNLSKKIYELDIESSSLSQNEIITKREQILTTIMGYHIRYHNTMGAVIFYECDNDSHRKELLKKMYLLKKNIRKKYVNDSDKYYIRIIDKDKIDFRDSIIDIDINNIFCKIKIYKSYEELLDEEYNMAFFNHIHCPDWNNSNVDLEMKVLSDSGIINSKSRIRKLL